MANEFINHSAAEDASNGAEGMWRTCQDILRPALTNSRVTIHKQIAESDKVMTRKTITGVHEGSLLGIAPTDKVIFIDVIDVVRLTDVKYVEHWGMNTLASVIAKLEET